MASSANAAQFGQGSSPVKVTTRSKSPPVWSYAIVPVRWGADERVWFVGHYGWYFYAKRAGLHQIHPSGARPGPGDLVIWPAQVNRGRSFRTPRSLGLELEAVDRIEYRGEVPARTMSPGGAGFYALLRGRPGRRVAVPYRFFDDSPLEVFEVYEVSGAK